MELTRAHRFEDNVGGLVHAIKAVGDGVDTPQALEVATQAVFDQTVDLDADLTKNQALLPRIYAQLSDVPKDDVSLQQQLVNFYRSLEELIANHEIEQALAQLDKMRLLCANNRGPGGSKDWNARMVKLLAKAQPKWRSNPYGERLGCVLMVTRNERTLGVSNGDTGLLGLEDNGTWTVYFPDGSGGIHTVPRARIECISLAYAITIHKSQGSQYEHAIVHLAQHAESPLNVRELFYTGVSRAKNRVSIVGSHEAIVHAIQTAITRASGLTARLTNEMAARCGDGTHSVE